jgi:5'-methylthioadenosine phosphorylase
MDLIGIISGTIPLQGKELFGTFKKKSFKTEFGKADVFISDTVAFIPRHGDNPNQYILPHLIKHQANMKALKDLGVKEVTGINSTGSLKKKLKPGTIVIPDDFIMLFNPPTTVSGKPVHITPVLNDGLRKRWLETARESKIDVVDGGIYWQTAGPRFETRSEIRMMSQFADLVGMTLASEATTAQELGLSYASVCSVDNYGHGLVKNALNLDEIVHNARRNADIIMKLISAYVERRRK